MSLTIKRIAKLAKSPGRYHDQFGLLDTFDAWYKVVMPIGTK
jgi:hypothetical protein